MQVFLIYMQGEVNFRQRGWQSAFSSVKLQTYYQIFVELDDSTKQNKKWKKKKKRPFSLLREPDTKYKL